VTFGAALDGIGWRGEASIGMPLSAYLELHIEQGPILEAEAKTIGVVTGVQGVRWYEASITGRESHAGTTPMPRRADAMVACARLALEVQRIALAHAPTNTSNNDAIAHLTQTLARRIGNLHLIPDDCGMTADATRQSDRALAAN